MALFGSLIGAANAATTIIATSEGDGFNHDMNGSIDDYFNSTGGVVEVGYYYDGDSSGRYTRHGYLQFDLNTLTETVVTATLNLYIVGNHHVDNSPSAGHILHRTDASSANGSASQRLNGDQYVAQNVKDLTNGSWVSYDVSSFLQSDQTNSYSYSVFSFSPDTSGGGWRNSRLAFASAESSNKPYLEINLIPEPSSILFLGLGCVGLAFRRSRW